MFIVGEIPVKKIQRPKKALVSSDTRFLYFIMQGENEFNFKTGQIFTNYEKVRKNAIGLVKRKNSTILKRMEISGPEGMNLFREVTPDCWTNGVEWIKINVTEIANS